ncbi:MAG: hypothetical protein WCF44_02175 [Candidatus Methylophosphatis roskildensis]|nr:hypothetical protein [Sterolibacteriaceae bacterium]MBK9087320.1 hypothetical protein [Sterolibacteriaceae bacterium]
MAQTVAMHLIQDRAGCAACLVLFDFDFVQAVGLYQPLADNIGLRSERSAAGPDVRPGPVFCSRFRRQRKTEKVPAFLCFLQNAKAGSWKAPAFAGAAIT